jgi:chromosome segregation ATPase
MSDQHTILSRIGSWFKRPHRLDHDLPLNENGNNGLVETRSVFFRPWARNEQRIQALQDGFHTLTDLMSAVRDNLSAQTQRQDELLKYLSHLPQALQSSAETNRVQNETLKAIYQQMESGNEQQQQLTTFLDKLTETSTGQRETLDAMRERIESVAEQDKLISDTLHGVGSALQTVSKTSHTSTEVLRQMRDNIDSRDGQLERILQRQNTRFTTMLAIAIFLSVAALVAVSLFGYLLLNKQ